MPVNDRRGEQKCEQDIFEKCRSLAFFFEAN
jgi:hypothetical protein